MDISTNQLKKAATPKDLETLGTADEIKACVEGITQPLSVRGSTYEELFAAIEILKEKWTDFIDGPFVSRQAELIFYLTKLEGKQRNKALGITDKHYEDPDHAKRWFRDLSKYVHDDKGGNDLAWRVLKELYDVMIDVEDENDG